MKEIKASSVLELVKKFGRMYTHSVLLGVELKFVARLKCLQLGDELHIVEYEVTPPVVRGKDYFAKPVIVPPFIVNGILSSRGGDIKHSFDTDFFIVQIESKLTVNGDIMSSNLEYFASCYEFLSEDTKLSEIKLVRVFA